jgi:hypothetical protein
MPNTKSRNYLIVAFVCSLWFALTSSFWPYYACLFISYPVGIAGFIFWRKADQTELPIFSRVIMCTLIGGLTISIMALTILLATN